MGHFVSPAALERYKGLKLLFVMLVDSVVPMATDKIKAQLWPVDSRRRHGASVRFQPPIQPVCAPTEKMF